MIKKLLRFQVINYDKIWQILTEILAKTGCLNKCLSFRTDMVAMSWLLVPIGKGLRHKRWYFLKLCDDYFWFYRTTKLNFFYRFSKYEQNGNTYNFFIFYPISKFIFAVYSSWLGLKICHRHAGEIIWRKKVGSRSKFDYFQFFAFFVKLWLRRNRITICTEMIATYCLQILREEDFANKIWYLSRRSDK